MQNISTQIDGSTELAADPFNDFASESENAIISSGQTLAPPTPKDNFQLAKAMATYAARGAFYRDVGTADNYNLLAFGSQQSPNEYIDGMSISFAPANTNTGISTVDVNALGNKVLKDASGNNLIAGALIAGIEYQFRYSAANDDFRLTGGYGGQTQFIPEWNSNIVYNVGDRVLRNGNTYRCTQITTAGDDPVGAAKDKWFSNEVVYRLTTVFEGADFSSVVSSYVKFYRQGNQITCSIGALSALPFNNLATVLTAIPDGFRPLLSGDGLSNNFDVASVYIRGRTAGGTLDNAYYDVIKLNATDYTIRLRNGTFGGSSLAATQLIWFTNGELVNATSTIHSS